MAAPLDDIIGAVTDAVGNMGQCLSGIAQEFSSSIDGSSSDRQSKPFYSRSSTTQPQSSSKSSPSSTSSARPHAPLKQVRLSITLEDVYRGCVKRFKVTQESGESVIIPITIEAGCRDLTKKPFPQYGVVFIVNHKEHPMFECSGTDLQCSYGIDLQKYKNSMNDDSVIFIQTLESHSRLSIPISKIVIGETLVFPNHGMPVPETNGTCRGNLSIYFFEKVECEFEKAATVCKGPVAREAALIKVTLEELYKGEGAAIAHYGDGRVFMGIAIERWWRHDTKFRLHDIDVTVMIIPHSVYDISGSDLMCMVELSTTQTADPHGSYSLPNIADASSPILFSTYNCSSGQQLVIPNHGFHIVAIDNTTSAIRGNLLVYIHVTGQENPNDKIPNKRSNVSKGNINGRLDDVPDILYCPITQEIFNSPVVASDGFTYERSAIQSWIDASLQNNEQPRSPMTNQYLASPTLVANVFVKNMVYKFHETGDCY